MNVHRVRRMAEVLVISQFRSGRSDSDPKGFFARPRAIALLDVAGFAGAAAVVAAGISQLPLGPSADASLAADAYPLLPILAVGLVLIAGIMFELTSTVKFSGSDAANWLPIRPREYVAASAGAIAYSYSPLMAVLLGGLLPFSVAGGGFAAYGLVFALSVAGLFEGGVLVEMVRAISQRAGASSSAHQGLVTIIARAALIVVMLLVFDLAFNPVFLLAFLKDFSSYAAVTTFVPFFWSTRALGEGVSGAWLPAGLFALGQVGFIGLLLAVAAALRERYWVPTGGDLQIVVPLPAPGHRFLRALGLSPPEAAIVSKDLRGLVRRRDMLPVLTLPAVLVVLLAVEARSLGAFGSLIWVGWVAGFFALFLSTRAVGQERRSFATLYAYPITARTVLRAKAASVILPAVLVAAVLTAAIGLLKGLSPGSIAAFGAVDVGDAIVLSVWGLMFAARYSDFQDRPRPQFLQQGPMLAALGSGMAVLFPVLVPAGLAILDGPTALSGILLAWSVGFAAAMGGLSAHWARTGFDRLLREAPS